MIRDAQDIARRTAHTQGKTFAVYSDTVMITIMPFSEGNDGDYRPAPSHWKLISKHEPDEWRDRQATVLFRIAYHVSAGHWCRRLWLFRIKGPLTLWWASRSRK